MTTLAKLNTLRTAIGMKPLKAWKESKAKLEAAIAKLEAVPQLREEETTDVPPIETPGDLGIAIYQSITDQSDTTTQEDTMAKTAKKAAKKVPAKKVVAKKAAKPATTKKTPVDGVKVSTIAEELGIDPKVARAKLRRHFGDTPKAGGGQWVFTKDKVAEIKSILKGDQRKKS